MSKKGIYNYTDYAKLKGVSRPYISKLAKKNKLIMVADEINKKWFIVDCDENDQVFKK